MQTCIWPSWCHCHSLSLSPVKSRLAFTFLLPAHLGSPRKRAIKRVCVIKLKDRFPGKELSERLGIDVVALVLQQNRLRWYGHVLRKEDDDWVKKCMEYEVEGPWPRGRPKRTWREVVKEDCQARILTKEDATDRSKWRKLMKDVWWSGWVFLLVPSYPGSLRPKAVVCVCMSLGNVRTSLLYWLNSDWWFYGKRNLLTVALLKSNINATTHASSSIYLGWMDVTNLQQVVLYFCYSVTVNRWRTVVSATWKYDDPRLNMSHEGAARVWHVQPRVVIFPCRTNYRVSYVLSSD